MQSPENGGKKLVEDEAQMLARVRATARELAGRLVKGKARADDIAQDVALDFLMRMRSGRAVQPEREDAYIATIVLRRRSDVRLRRRRAAARDWTYLREITASRREWMDPEVSMRTRELEALYQRTLDSLPVRCRRAFVAVREQGQSYADAARSLGVSEKMIAKYVTQAQHTFRRALREHGIHVPRAKRVGRNEPIPFVSLASRPLPVAVPVVSPPHDRGAEYLAALRRTAAVFQHELASRESVAESQGADLPPWTTAEAI